MTEAIADWSQNKDGKGTKVLSICCIGVPISASGHGVTHQMNGCRRKANVLPENNVHEVKVKERRRRIRRSKREKEKGCLAWVEFSVLGVVGECDLEEVYLS
jgi:hypothetical protein